MESTKAILRNISRQHFYTDIEQKQCIQTLLSSTIFRDAQHIFVYIALKREISTYELIEKAFSLNKHIYVPHVDWEFKTMHMCALKSLSDVKTDKLGLYKPGTCAPQKTAEVAIVPCSMVSKDGTRLGTGGGYYDRFFSTNLIPIRLAVSSYPDILETLPKEKHDIPMTHILTPQRLYSVSTE